MPAGRCIGDGERPPKGGPSGVPAATERGAMDGDERGIGMSDRAFRIITGLVAVLLALAAVFFGIKASSGALAP